MIKTKKAIVNGIRLYLSGAIVYSIGILLFRYSPYYQKTLSSYTQRTLIYLYLGYLILSPIYYFFFAEESSESKPFLALHAIYWIITPHSNKNKSEKMDKEEKIALLFILVKLFFLPTMINFFYGNINGLISIIKNFSWYPLAVTLIFTADTAIFAFGYAFESKFLKNIVKSVEPTLFGWAVALICYPPFNSYAGKFFAWGANDYASFWNAELTFIIRIVLAALLTIYLWATFALGFKSSNLTNRGIVSKFPYSVVRHPAYISKNLVWWITLLPVMGVKFALGMLFWTIIYYYRAITEENHLSHDADYIEYKKKVKYKFVPYLL